MHHMSYSSYEAYYLVRVVLRCYGLTRVEKAPAVFLICRRRPTTEHDHTWPNSKSTYFRQQKVIHHPQPINQQKKHVAQKTSTQGNELTKPYQPTEKNHTWPQMTVNSDSSELDDRQLMTPFAGAHAAVARKEPMIHIYIYTLCSYLYEHIVPLK